MGTKIIRDLWSDESKRSYAFHYQSHFYEDIHYKCAKCGVAAVFTAEEQRISFEEKKNYIWQHRRLCPPCNAELFRLRRSEREHQTRWSRERSSLMRDTAFLREWLSVLKCIPKYAPRYRNSMAQRLEALLKRADGHAS